jgi:hypothetical protein
VETQPTFRFVYKPFSTTWISIIMVVLLFPLGLSLPRSWGWENGPLENIQVLILSIGLVLSWFAAQHNRDNRNVRNLWLWLILFWLLCIGRELSWGRVFYPVALGENGPEFLSIHQVWYGPWVHPFVAIASISMLIGIYCSSPLQYLRQAPLPLFDIAIVIIMAIITTWFEKTTIQFLHPYRVLLEEWAELTVYWSLVSIEIIIGLKNRATPSVTTVLNSKYIQ